MCAPKITGPSVGYRNSFADCANPKQRLFYAGAEGPSAVEHGKHLVGREALMLSSNTSICTVTKRDGTGCKHRTQTGESVCWQHARGLTARWRSLPPKYQWLGLWLTAVSVMLTIALGLPLIWTKAESNPPAVNNELLSKQLQDVSQDIQARQVQTTEQVRVLQKCVSNPNSGKCSESVGARLRRSPTESIHVEDSARVIVKKCWQSGYAR